MKAVKRLMTVILCVITALIFTIPASAASTKNDSRSLTVGVPTDRCPVFYNDDVTGDIVGIGIDLMRYSAEKAGFVVNFKEIKEETLPEAIEIPEYFIPSALKAYLEQRDYFQISVSYVFSNVR